jgi:hypothetical protein
MSRNSFASCLALFLCTCPLSAADWRTAAHDATRSGRTEDAAPPPYRVRWAKAWQYENIATVSQLIVAQGRGYIGTLGRDGSFAGKAHCVDIADGKDLWTYDDLQGGIAHSLTWSEHEGGTVYAATTLGEVVALSAATGELRWKFRTPLGGFVVNPCVAGGAVLLGSRQGVFYALDEANGRPRWERDLGIPICNTAAAADGIVYFVDEGMHAHALQIADGKPVAGWTSTQLPGGAARFYWPVIAGEHVLFTVAPPHKYNWAETDGVLFKVPGVKDRKSDHFAIGTPEQEREEQNNVAAFLQEHPHSQVMHCLKRGDGRPACLPGVLYTGGSGSECAPPVVSQAGRIYVEYRSFYSLWDSDSWVNPYSALGELNPATGVVTQLRPQLDNDKRLPWGQVWIIADESSTFTLAGDTLFVSHQGNFGGFDLGTKKTFAGVGKRDTWGGYPPLSWNRQEWHGAPRSPLTVVDGTVYYVVGARVIACEGNARPGAKNAEAIIVSAAPKKVQIETVRERKEANRSPSVEDLKAILDQTRDRKLAVNEERVKPLRAALERHIADLLLTPDHGAFHEWRGIGQSRASMTSREDLIYALSLAYPHLGDQQRARVERYIAEHLTQDGAAKPAEPDLARSTPRNFHRVDTHDLLASDRRAGFQHATQAIYVHARNLAPPKPLMASEPQLAAPSLLEQAPDALARRLAAGQLDARQLREASRHISLAVSRAQLAALGEAPEEYGKRLKELQAILPNYLAIYRHFGRQCAQHIDALPGGTEHPSAGGQFRNLGGPYVGKTHAAEIAFFTDMSPEIGRILKEFAPEETAAIKAWMLRNAQGFYLARWDTPVQEGEVTAPWYNTTQNYFHVFSTIDGGDFETHLLLVDAPVCRADVYYIERLVRALEAGTKK